MLQLQFNKLSIKLKKYVLISALMSIFSGPLIESTFNIMDDIVEKDRSKLTVENYEAVAIVKTSLKRKKVSAVKFIVNSKMIKANKRYQKILTEKKKIKKRKSNKK